MDRITVMIAGSILLLSIFPFVSANPMPMSVWEDAQAGGSPEPQLKNTNVTFFKEIVKAVIDGEKVKVHADYWFRNERHQNETIKILLPLSKNPRDIDLKADDLPTGWVRSFYMYDDSEYGSIDYEAIAFDLVLMDFDEVKVTVEFWDNLSKYDISENDHVTYFYSYLVGSAKAWNRNLESAYFEFRIPVSMYDGGEYGGWTREKDGSDYVFTKEYADWLPFDNDHESLTWEKDRSILSMQVTNHPRLTVGNILMVVAIAAISIIVLVTALMMYRSRKKRNA